MRCSHLAFLDDVSDSISLLLGIERDTFILLIQYCKASERCDSISSRRGRHSMKDSSSEDIERACVCVRVALKATNDDTPSTTSIQAIAIATRTATK